MAIEILYHDNHLLAACKPAGQLTQGEDGSGFQEECRQWVKEHKAKSGNAFLHVLHRLDRPVSGIVLCALTSKALSRMQAEMRNNSIEKYYLAQVEGIDLPESGTLEHYLFHDEIAHCAVVATPSKGKHCLLKYQVIERYSSTTLVEIKLETGRYHQIRAQMSAFGHPILGDQKYRSKLPFAPGIIALHHHKMIFQHPVQKSRITIECQAPF